MPTFSRQGSEQSVNSATSSSQSYSRIAALPNGGYVIVWWTGDAAQDGNSGAIKAQIFDSAGLKVGAEFLVNTASFSYQTAPAVTAIADGRFVIAWDTGDSAQDGDMGAIKAQLFNADGSKL